MSYRYDEERPSRLTLLVHPDCSIELGEEKCREFVQRVKAERGLGTVITHWFFWDSYEQHLKDEGDDRLELYRDVRREVGKLGVARHDRRVYRETFDQELLDWLIDNAGGKIVIGGGYWDLCVRQTYKALVYGPLLNILREQKVRVTVDPKICYFRQYEFGVQPWEEGDIDDVGAARWFTADKESP